MKQCFTFTPDNFDSIGFSITLFREDNNAGFFVEAECNDQKYLNTYHSDDLSSAEIRVLLEIINGEITGQPAFDALRPVIKLLYSIHPITHEPLIW